MASLADADPVFGEEIGALLGQPYDLLLGRKTYEIFAAHWPYAEGGPDDEIAKQFNRSASPQVSAAHLRRHEVAGASLGRREAQPARNRRTAASHSKR